MQERNATTGWVALHEAAFRGHMDCVKVRMEQVRVWWKGFFGGGGAFVLGSREGGISVVELYLDQSSSLWKTINTPAM